MNIIIENVPPEYTNEKLESVFSKFGFVEYVHISRISDEYSEQSIGIVDMPIKSQAYAAVKKLNGKKLSDYKVKVNITD